MLVGGGGVGPNGGKRGPFAPQERKSFEGQLASTCALWRLIDPTRLRENIEGFYTWPSISGAESWAPERLEDQWKVSQGMWACRFLLFLLSGLKKGRSHDDRRHGADANLLSTFLFGAGSKGVAPSGSWL